MNKCLDCGIPVQAPLVFCDLCVMKQTTVAKTSPTFQTYSPSATIPAVTGQYVQQQAYNIPITQQGYGSLAMQPFAQPLSEKKDLPPPPPIPPRYNPK